jgi:phage shock protein E
MNKITVQELKTLMDNNPGLLLIDVRSHTEYLQGHIPNAINIPIQGLYENADVVVKQIQELIKNQTTFYVVCLSDRRSYMACMRLHDYDISNGSYIEGGTQEWISAGYLIQAEKIH